MPLEGGREYALYEYRAAQRGGTEWMADHSRRMLQFVEAAMTEKDRRAGKDPRRRLKSYLLQEAEAVSRYRSPGRRRWSGAKLAACE